MTIIGLYTSICNVWKQKRKRLWQYIEDSFNQPRPSQTDSDLDSFDVVRREVTRYRIDATTAESLNNFQAETSCHTSPRFVRYWVASRHHVNYLASSSIFSSCFKVLCLSTKGIGARFDWFSSLPTMCSFFCCICYHCPTLHLLYQMFRGIDYHFEVDFKSYLKLWTNKQRKHYPPLGGSVTMQTQAERTH